MPKDDFRIDGLDALIRDIEKLGRVPQTAVTQAARAGARIAYKAAKANAPVDTGELQQAIIMKKERKKVVGKAVFDAMIDPGKNDIFVKYSKEGDRSYYPASQEYGFLTVSGRYVPGYRYLRRAIDENKENIERTVLDRAGKEIDKALSKKGLR